MPEPAEIAIFDVCGTLYAANTTAGFIRFVHDREGARLENLVVSAITHRMSPFRYASHVAGKVMGFDFGRALLLKTLKGRDMAGLRSTAVDYVRHDLVHRRIRASWQILDEQIRRGKRVILLSNSIEPVVSAIAAELQVEHHGSTLTERGGRCTGAIGRDLTGAKHTELERVLASAEAERRPHVTVVTDNTSDLALLKAADERVVIWRGKSPSRAFSGLEAQYVRVAQ